MGWHLAGGAVQAPQQQQAVAGRRQGNATTEGGDKFLVDIVGAGVVGRYMHLVGGVQSCRGLGGGWGQGFGWC